MGAARVISTYESPLKLAIPIASTARRYGRNPSVTGGYPKLSGSCRYGTTVG